MATNALAQECCRYLRELGLRVVANVVASERSIDLAIAMGCGQLAVIRCTHHEAATDRNELATMVEEGDFVWAGLVYGDHNGSGPESPVESFHLTEVEKLVARLRALGACDP